MKPFKKRWNSYDREEKLDVVLMAVVFGTMVWGLWMLVYLLEGGL